MHRGDRRGFKLGLNVSAFPWVFKVPTVQDNHKESEIGRKECERQYH